MDKYIGKKVRAFSFDNGFTTNNLKYYFLPEMEDYTNSIGIVKEDEDDMLLIEFPDTEAWWYPREEAIRNIVTEVFDSDRKFTVYLHRTIGDVSASFKCDKCDCNDNFLRLHVDGHMQFIMLKNFEFYEIKQNVKD